MLSGLILENFKAFGGRHPIIPLAPITLIFGANSAGKSSIIDALALPQINKLDRKKGIGSDIVSNLSYVVLQDDVFNNDTTLDSSVTIHISKYDINSQSVLDYAMRSIPKRFHNKVSLVINIKNVYSRDPISIQHGENGYVSITQEGWDAVNSSDLLKITHIGSIRDVTGYQDSGQPNYLRGSHSRADLLIITALSINRSSLLILALSPAANAVDIISMKWDGINWREVSRSMALS